MKRRADRHEISKFNREYPRLRGLFARARIAATPAVPAVVQDNIRTELESAAGLGMETITDAALAPQTPVTEEMAVDGGNFWITQDAGVICGNMLAMATSPHGQAVQVAPGGCRELSQMVTRGFVEITGTASTENAWGMVPSTVSSVSVSTGPGSPETVPVSHGGFNASFTGTAPYSVTFTGAGGVSVTDG